MELTASDIWSRILQEARDVLPEQAFRTWLAPTEAVGFSEDLLIISTPNPFAATWVEDKYAEMLTDIAERAFGRRFRLSVEPGTDRAAPPVHAPAPAPPPPPAAHPSAGFSMPAVPQGGVRDSGRLNDRYTFDRFVVGNNNQLSAAAAHAVAEAPARTYNPLFIYGGVGLGKTHLMHAVGQVVLERHPSKRVVYLSSERFTNDLVSAIQGGTMAEFRRQYRQIDLLLVDDVQFLEGKRQTQEEFFHTFNALYEAQRQIVLTSDRPPKEIGLEDRLISRFEWGLVTDIQPPDFETRVAILRKKLEEDELEIADEQAVLDFIAHNCTSSVREIEGAVIKLLAFSSLTRREINLDLAREALGGTLRPDAAGGEQTSPHDVRRLVAAEWGVTPDGLQSKRRTKDLTVPRQVAMFLIKERFDLSLVDIGKLFGGRDHSTVIHSVAKVEEDMAADEAFRERVTRLRASVF